MNFVYFLEDSNIAQSVLSTVSAACLKTLQTVYRVEMGIAYAGQAQLSPVSADTS